MGVAFVAILVTAPVMLLAAVLIRITSRGPVLYAQTRVGRDGRNTIKSRADCRRSIDLGGRPFTIYKFRTMYHVAEQERGTWASPDDPRVTPVGRVLRKTRIDELPQLFNVLWGDMNIVGPRPEQPSIFQDLRKQIRHYEHRQRVPPGITGWAQINHHYDSSVDDVRRKVEFDLEYIGRRSLAEDCKIMVRTLPVMLFQRGAW